MRTWSLSSASRAHVPTLVAGYSKTSFGVPSLSSFNIIQKLQQVIPRSLLALPQGA